MPKVSVGERAPTFRRVAHDGEVIEIGDQPLDRVLVLYFYPKDETPGCTAQACHFRDAYSDFADAGAKVVGVSGDSRAAHEAFASRHGLPFSLISDEDGSLRRAFGVPKTAGLVPGRVTYVIDHQGIVRLAFNSQLRAVKHVAVALDSVREMVLKAG